MGSQQPPGAKPGDTWKAKLARFLHSPKRRDINFSHQPSLSHDSLECSRTAQSVPRDHKQSPSRAKALSCVFLRLPFPLNATMGGEEGFPRSRTRWEVFGASPSSRFTNAVGKGFPRTRTRREVEARGLMQASSTLRIPDYRNYCLRTAQSAA